MQGPGWGYDGAVDVTLADADLSKCCRGFVVTTGGTLKVTMEDGSTATIGVVAGIEYHMHVKRFWSTGTSSVAGVVAFF